MTHFVGAVFVPANRSEDQYLEQVLERFDENREVPEYIDSDVDTWEKEVKRARQYFLEERAADYPEAAQWSDLKVLNHWGGTWRARESGNGYDSWTTYNPESRWDWWSIGGRWQGAFAEGDRLDVTVAKQKLADADAEKWHFPYSIVTPQGEWVEKGRMGWWGTHQDNLSDQEWHALVLQKLEEFPAGHLVFIDFHI